MDGDEAGWGWAHIYMYTSTSSYYLDEDALPHIHTCMHDSTHHIHIHIHIRILLLHTCMPTYIHYIIYIHIISIVSNITWTRTLWPVSTSSAAISGCVASMDTAWAGCGRTTRTKD